MAARIGILGGSFNPVHVGHVRLAIEVRERLGLERVDLAPCSLPPHKPAAGLLDFALRKRLVELALAAADGLPAVEGLAVNALEAARTGPSYTYDTLLHYRRTEPAAQLFFILGGGDLLTLPQWRRGLELPWLAHFVVVPRDVHDLDDVAAFIAQTWPEATATPPAPPATAAWTFSAPAASTQLVYLPTPRLDISGTQVRQAWRDGKSLRYMLPAAVERELIARREEINAVWR